MNAPLPPDEQQRLAALHACAVLDTAPEGAFDDITRLAAEILQTPISLVSLVDESRQWFKSRHGLTLDQTPRAYSFCAHAILEPDEVFEVEDARRDPRFADNPMVTGEPHIRFYAGVALTTSDGRALGTLNVIDARPRRLDEREKDILSILGRQVVAQLELRRKAYELRNEAQERLRSEAAIRREYEQALGQLREAKAFSDRVTEVLPSVLYVYDLAQRRSVFVNREVYEALGYRQADVMGDAGDPVVRLMHPQDLAAFESHMARVVQLPDGESEEFTYRMRHADGSWRWFHSRDAVMSRREDGSVSTIVGSATDITEVKLAAEAVQASERRFRALAESSAIGIVEADSRRGVVYVNERAAEMAGRSPAECLADGWIDALHPMDRERITKAWQAVLRDRRSFQDHFRFQHRSGRVVDVLVDGRALVGAAAEGDHYVATIVDVTVLREVEQHRLAREAAEQANRAKSDFLARMSHELRTPLNAILGFAQLMQIDPAVAADARSKQRVDQIRLAGDHLLHLVNEVLDLARVEAGRIELHLQPIPVASIAAQSVRLIEPQAQARGLTLEVDLAAAERATVRADEVRLREVLLNLLSNAVKYNRPGGSIRLIASVDEAEVTLRVEDAGPGLTPEQLANLFQPFNRLGAERTQVEGSGLGLAISKRLAEAMGARLQAASVPGQGSSFTLALPRA
jgi:PAS domain S-box-containing protein